MVRLEMPHRVQARSHRCVRWQCVVGATACYARRVRPQNDSKPGKQDSGTHLEGRASGGILACKKANLMSLKGEDEKAAITE